MEDAPVAPVPMATEQVRAVPVVRPGRPVELERLRQVLMMTIVSIISNLLTLLYKIHRNTCKLNQLRPLFQEV